MILYNVTVVVEDSIHDQWLEWMQNVHVPEVMETGIFSSFKICKILTPPEEGTSYSIQYFCKTMSHFERYDREFAPALRKSVSDKYGDKQLSFRTLMHIVDQSL